MVRRMGRVTVLLIASLLFLLAGAGAALAQEPADIVLDSPIRGIEIDAGRERADLDVNLVNRADARRTVAFVLEGVPEGWEVAVWSRFFDFRINQLVVEPTAAHPNRVQQVRLRISPPPDPQPGTYTFTLRVTSPDGAVEYESATYSVRVREGAYADDAGVSVRAEIPVLRGAPGTTFGFEILVRNDTAEEVSLRLSAQPPPGWQLTFREFFGERRVIDAVSTPAGLDDRIRVDVRPPLGTRLGTYEIPLVVIGDGVQVETVLRAELVGQGTLRVEAPTGGLTLDALAGRQVAATLRVTNAGTDLLEDVQLIAEPPPGWTVEFGVRDNTIASLAPNQHLDVPVTLLPPSDAVAGDYLVRARASHPLTSATLSYRVTVDRGGVWGWLVAMPLLLVIGGVVGLFLRLGRR